MKAYKLFRYKNGLLYPLYVLADNSISLGIWMDAKDGERTKNGKVKSKIGPLCYRPGWHLSEIPLATHIGIKVDGVIKYMHDDHVWCECEYDDRIDYQGEADYNGMLTGKMNKRNAMLKHIPVCGCYRYKTSPVMDGEWIISGGMKVNRLLSDEEVADICAENGRIALPRRFK